MSFRRALPGPECKRAAPWCRKGLGIRDLGLGDNWLREGVLKWGPGISRNGGYRLDFGVSEG